MWTDSRWRRADGSMKVCGRAARSLRRSVEMKREGSRREGENIHKLLGSKLQYLGDSER